MERRTLPQPVEARADDNGRSIAGYGAVFNVTTDLGWFRERIAPGAFRQSIADGDIRSLFNHDSALILGRTKSGTLRLNEDDTGLHYEVDLPDTQAGRDLIVSMDRGDIDGSSFMFIATRQEWDETDPDSPLRTILEAQLFEVGPVTFPAYEASEVHLRDARTALEEARAGNRSQHNAVQAAARIAARRAAMEQKIRGISR
jgi:HK97 family phage prohead protease